MRRPLLLIGLALAAWVWLAAIVAAPLVSRDATATRSRMAAMIYIAGSFICHQRPDRSFHLDGAQLAVCARCTGLYLGGAIGVLAWALVRGLGGRPSSLAAMVGSGTTARSMLIIAATPTAISLATGLSGLWSPGDLARAALAVPLGAAIGAVASAVLTRDLS